MTFLQWVFACLGGFLCGMGFAIWAHPGNKLPKRDARGRFTKKPETKVGGR